MKIITFSDIKNLNISYSEMYDWACEMLLHKDGTVLPPKISMSLDYEGSFLNVMPSIIPDTVLGYKVSGVKMVSRYPDNIPALESKIVLFNSENGDTLAFMDATWITAMRTGAVAAHSIMNFAVKGFTEISMLGLGNTARATLLILLSQLDGRKVHIRLLKHKGQEEDFVQRFSEYDNVSFSFEEDVNKLVKGAQVVISCVTFAGYDLCRDDSFDEGVLLVPVHTRGFTNCDLFFDKIYGDDYGHICHFKNFAKFKSFAEVADVIGGKAVGRENDRERIIAYNVGIAIHDINFAAHIYKMLEDKREQEIDLGSPLQKFWV